MQCNACKGTGKVEVGSTDNHYEEECDVCNGTGGRDIVLTVTLWDEDNEREIASETVPTVSLLQGIEALRRIVKYAQEN